KPAALIPNGCPDIGAPAKLLASVQTSGTNGAGARPPSQNWRKYLKSANTVKYLSQISRSNEPYRYSRSVAATSGVRSAKLNNCCSAGRLVRAVYWVLVNWLAVACGVGVCAPPARYGSNTRVVTRLAKLPLR